MFIIDFNYWSNPCFLFKNNPSLTKRLLSSRPEHITDVITIDYHQGEVS